MRGSTVATAAGLLALATPVLAAPEPDTVGFQFEKRRVVRSERTQQYQKRQTSGTVNAVLDNAELLYLINVTVGTPGQPLSLQLDTGSSDIWFPSSSANVCTAGECDLGSFDATKSSSYKNLTELGPFTIQYVDGSQIEGSYLSDTLTLSNTKLTNTTMALATSATRGEGIMGIGFQSDESSAQSQDPSVAGFTYPNIINVLKNEGHINTLSYSLWLDDLDSSTGSILFGGVDSSKYHAPLISLPIQDDPQSGNITSFTVTWTGLTVHDYESGQTVTASPSTPQPAILDSGTSLTYVPDAIAEQLFNAFGVTTDPELGELISCNLAANNVSFGFQFGGDSGPTINVPLSEMLVPLLTDDGKQAHFRNGEPACNFGIEAAGQDPILFGDTFLRSAYVVYDLENLQVGLANTNFESNTDANSVSAIDSSGVPGISSTASAVTVQQTFTGNPLITGGFSGTAVGTAAATGTGATSRSATLKLTASGTNAPSGVTGTGAVASGSSGSSHNGAGNMGGSSRVGAVVAGFVTSGFALGFAMMLLLL